MLKKNTRAIVFMALLCAVSIVVGRLLVVYITPSLRISFGNIPIILAGIWLGPVAGAIVGGASDIFGAAIFSGLGWFPPLSMGPVLMGFIPALFRGFIKQRLSFPRVFLAVFAADFIASIGWNTFWLSRLYGTGMLSLLSVRVPLYIGIAILESIAVFLLKKSAADRLICGE